MVKDGCYIMTRDWQLTKDDMARYQIVHVANFRGSYVMPEKDIDSVVDDMKHAYEIIFTSKGEVVYNVREVLDDFLGTTISAIFFRDLIFMEMYMMKSPLVFKEALTKLMN
jgi:hypothetical protein